VSAVRHGVSFDISDTSTEWSRLLNIPPQSAQGGYVSITAQNAVVAIRAVVTVENVEDVRYFVAAPGEPAEIPVSQYGVDLYFMAQYVTPYTHDEATGLPSTTANNTGSVRGCYLADQPVPDRPIRRVWDRREVQFANATTSQAIRVPLGPPGLYRVLRAAIMRTVNGSSNATQITLMRIFPRGDGAPGALSRDAAAYSNTAVGVSGGWLPYITTLQGGTHPRIFQSRDGWAEFNFEFDLAPAADETYTVWQGYEYLGPGQLAPIDSVVVA